MGFFTNRPNPMIYDENVKNEADVVNREVDSDTSGREQDDADMARMGKRQQTRRNFGLLTMLSFTATMMCTWEAMPPYFSTGVQNGGPVTMIYGLLFAWLGSLLTCASLAEMASMFPTSGGQYHWVAILAPPRFSKPLSWFTGWISVLGWQAGVATGTIFGGIVAQGLIVLNNESYTPQRWQGTLMCYAVLLITLTVNTVMAKYLPALEGIILILHILGFFALLIPLVHLSPLSSAKYVFTDRTVYSGYEGGGLPWFIGMATLSIAFVGYDGACHMAEEVRRAAVNVPRSMMFTILLNGVLGLAIVIAFLFCIGNVEEVLKSPTGWPFIQIIQNGIGSKAGTTVLVSMLIAMFIFSTFGFLASASRQAWAFARDRGLPCSQYISRIHPRFLIPMWAIALTVIINALLALINIASSAAWSAIVSLLAAGFYTSYIIAIGCLIWRRFQPEPVALGPWNLGRYGLAINIAALIYDVLVMVFSFFPPAVPVKKDNMNYSIVVYSGVVIFGVIYYNIWGHRNYNGPVIDRQFTS